MILHELVTNAVKYGALSDPRGQVNLTWSVRQCDETRCALRWQESGGPPVRPPVRKGFGTTLLKGALREANARVDFQPEGLATSWRCRLPSSRQKAPLRRTIERLHC